MISKLSHRVFFSLLCFALLSCGSKSKTEDDFHLAATHTKQNSVDAEKKYISQNPIYEAPEGRSLVPQKNLIYDPQTDQSSLTVSLAENKKTVFTRQFQFAGELFASIDCSTLFVGENIYVFWVEKNLPDISKERLRLTIVEWPKDKIVFDGEITSSKQGALKNVRLAYLAKSKQVMMLWSDTALDFEEESLFYTTMAREEEGFQALQVQPFFPKKIRTIKGSPTFYDHQSGTVFLTVTTGYRYGSLAYSGQRSFGVGKIGLDGRLEEYGLVAWPDKEISQLWMDPSGRIFFKPHEETLKTILFEDVHKMSVHD